MMFLAMLACKTPAQAPTELNELSRFFFREHPSEDQALLGEGLERSAQDALPAVATRLGHGPRHHRPSPLPPI